MFTGAIPQKQVTSTDKGFDELGLSDAVLAVLGSVGFEHPTPIQSECVPRMLEGREVIGLAQTGSGKTAAFCLPLVERLRDRPPAGGKRASVPALILSPTREIALQTESFLAAFERLGVRTACLIGGARFEPQIRDLRASPHVVVATPGRLLDHLERRNLGLRDLETLVIDEADRMLDMGFMPQITRILQHLPDRRQTVMFSATMPVAVERLAKRFMTDPIRIDILPEGRAAEGIDHRLYLVGRDDKRDCLMALVERETGSMLVFVRMKVDAEWACKQIEEAGHPVERMHGDRSQSQRVAALEGLRGGEHRVLVATDVAARGLDLPIIGHIVNFDMPETVEDYIHRAGRTARGDAGGVVSTIATWQDKPMIRQLEKALRIELPRDEAPGVEPYEELDHAKRKTIKGRERIRRRFL